MNKFQLKTTMFCQDIARYILLTLILAQGVLLSTKILQKIPKFEKMYLFFYINYGNTSSYQVSGKNTKIAKIVIMIKFYAYLELLNSQNLMNLLIF